MAFLERIGFKKIIGITLTLTIGWGVSVGQGAWASEHAAAHPKSVTKAEISTAPLINLGGEVHATSLPKMAETHGTHAPSAKATAHATGAKKTTTTHSGPKAVKTPEHKVHKHWRYVGEEGPSHWGDLAPDYIMCKIGKNQSPIDINEAGSVGTTHLPRLDVNFKKSTLRVLNNGHTVQVNVPVGSYIVIGHHRYELLQYHFHTPSEHTRNGVHYPMEMHFVHKDSQGNLAVLGVLFEEGKTNPFLDGIILNTPIKLNKTRLVKEISFNPANFLPKNRTFFKYSGSLTTPPCSEGVTWTVFKYPIQASAGQLQEMADVLKHNNRPVQKHYARSILKSYADKSNKEMVYEFY